VNEPREVYIEFLNISGGRVKGVEVLRLINWEEDADSCCRGDDPVMNAIASSINSHAAMMPPDPAVRQAQLQVVISAAVQ